MEIQQKTYNEVITYTMDWSSLLDSLAPSADTIGAYVATTVDGNAVVNSTSIDATSKIQYVTMSAGGVGTTSTVTLKITTAGTSQVFERTFAINVVSKRYT